MTDRFRLSRAGVLNVWQYDDQVFEFAGGRLLLRGSNGAGKSKTLEMLLPFVLDGDKARMTASGRHHTSLLWLMLDGYSGQNRAGYLWVEFANASESFTCGIGVRASQSARQAVAWYFTLPGRIGVDLELEDDAGPLARERLRAAVEERGGHFFDSPRAYKQHVGRTLFGLEPLQYDELLRLLYWLRQPQVGEDIEPARLAEQLVQALPQIDDDAVRSAGDTFDELAAFGEQLDRQRRSAEGVAAFARVYADYAREVLRARGSEVTGAHTERTRRVREVERCAAALSEIVTERESARRERSEAGRERSEISARLAELHADPLMRTERELAARRTLAGEHQQAAQRAAEAAASAQRRAGQAGTRVRTDAGQLGQDLRGFSGTAGGHATELSRVGARAALAIAPGLQEPRLSAAADAAAVVEAVDRHKASVDAARPVLGELRAAVQVVEEALAAFDKAAADRERAEEDAAKAEQQAEAERGRLADARGTAERAEWAYSAALDGWRAAPRAVGFELPGELTAEAVAAVPAIARAAAEPVLERLRAERATAAANRTAAERALDEAGRRRAAILAEADPAPAEPTWARSPRDGADGAPLWRLIDFVDGLEDAQRAGVEAALEASGLLDAWVRADGAVLDADRNDTVLPAGPAVVGRSLGDVLVPDPPVSGPVTAGVVAGVLARVALAPKPAETAAVALDGSWRLGPLTGRATKPVAQYIGATARAAERARRLAELDALIAVHTEARETAAAAEQVAADSARAVEEWLAAAPPTDELIAAWTLLEERTRTTERAERIATEAEDAATRARSVETGKRRELHEIAVRHDLPAEAGPLASRREALRALDTALAAHLERGGALAARLRRWADDAAAWETLLGEAEETAREAEEADGRAAEARAAADELEATVDAPLREIRRRIELAEKRDAELRRREGELGARIDQLLTAGGAAEQASRDAVDRLAEHEPVLADAVAAFAALADVPGLLDSGDHQPDDERAVEPTDAAIGLARGFTAGSPVPASVLAIARRFAGLPAPARSGTTTAVFAAWQEAASGPAGDVDPRVVDEGVALAVIGRDDAGEHPIGALAQRLAAAVARDADLLTERERRLFEEHILGDLGESLRSRRLEAEELVTEMNNQLRGVSTSQGIQVQLRWNLREDVSADARRAVELLGRPVGALLPGERRELRDALHRLIEASRADAPEDSYTEHLTRALDYRRWFAFRIRYTRPETAGTWHDLHRRSPLSQGEQKVVCYLPLFAAAAAHFSSLAGAAPHSPRFVLLDDAFPKIDIRTHPLLFGLLVQLDLDFVVTSERLWGDHDTVPSLAIYEALRDPNERGIAQYRHTWDGQRLHAVG
ncbi:TIGR02680 family protein [Pseudonocardia sp. DSM 110487]|uniref:TIGR02680 family protein n=1 Tax=Pseudonocardia sp. DSM 110487 TaxID=2865833 RepID=UPI001C694F2A|nr:TIGR02680 family protein [Pseudonocardia sp. DSM 110487]QYN37760.1 TIGR02680 family protein [Pseudonocardia sp. DSM 110487]